MLTREVCLSASACRFVRCSCKSRQPPTATQEMTTAMVPLAVTLVPIVKGAPAWSTRRCARCLRNAVMAVAALARAAVAVARVLAEESRGAVGAVVALHALLRLPGLGSEPRGVVGADDGLQAVRAHHRLQRTHSVDQCSTQRNSFALMGHAAMAFDQLLSQWALVNVPYTSQRWLSRDQQVVGTVMIIDALICSASCSGTRHTLATTL